MKSKMPLVIMAILLVVVLAIMAILPTVMQPVVVVSSPINKVAYFNEAHRYILEYPETWEIVEHSNDHISFGVFEEGFFVAMAEVQVYHNAQFEGAPGEFSDRAIYLGRKVCATEGPDRYMRCANVQMLQPITTQAGNEGITFYLRHEIVETASGSVLLTSGRGPFFAFDMFGEKTLMLFSPEILPEGMEPSPTLQAIAETISY